MTAVRPARREEAAALTALCLASKAYWGYDADFMAACRAELTLTPDAIAAGCIGVVDGPSTPAGVAEVSLKPDGRASLDKLFVAPDQMGRAIGRTLFLWLCDQARAMGADMLEIEADPGAESFYRAMGAQRVGEVPSGSIPGRVLPLLRFDLHAGP